ncbi:unnamed protein product [Hymenolepis diminuta]|uniref:Organ specific protein n=1 Tax=Hymenolepis diminuta TaxID=6216 RepID=A0A158QG65_HYMDI|nr:unnamed protein product [Hymenolepis diminuta]
MASSTVGDIPTLDAPLALDSKKTDKQWKETAEAQITEAPSADGSKAIRNINDSTEYQQNISYNKAGTFRNFKDEMI